MNGEIQERPTNKTPMIYTGGDFITPYPMTKEFIRELADLYNKYGIDSKLNMRDFLLAEMSYNFLAVMHNTMRKENEMRDDTNEGQALLYAVEKTAERTKNEVIDKAVKWMYNYFVIDHYGMSDAGFGVFELVFRQAMQDESK